MVNAKPFNLLYISVVLWHAYGLDLSGSLRDCGQGTLMRDMLLFTGRQFGRSSPEEMCYIPGCDIFMWVCLRFARPVRTPL